MIAERRRRAGCFSGRWSVLCCLVGILLLLCAPVEGRGVESQARLDSAIDWGGHLRMIGVASCTEEGSFDDFDTPEPAYDGQLEWRLKNRLTFGRSWSIDTHYELVGLGGDAYRALRTQQALFHQVPGVTAKMIVDDDRRLLDLTHVLEQTDRSLVYHRLDRLSLTHRAAWGSLKLGRQALTWGDGLIFNPMDLFNPFSPTAVQRDYKIGDDMVVLQMPWKDAELQLLYLPRRNPQSGKIEEDAASYAGKYHWFFGSVEMDAMLARHYGEAVTGLGASGYWGGAAWRANAVYTRLKSASRRNDALQLVANLDYAWTWGEKNLYGLVEVFYNSLGRTENYGKALFDTDLAVRLERGELFTGGRCAVAGQLQVELHPLVRLQTTTLVNVADPSGVLQPQLHWDMIENVALILGGQWSWGAAGSEFGGYPLVTEEIQTRVAPDDRLYLWVTAYF